MNSKNRIWVNGMKVVPMNWRDLIASHPPEKTNRKRIYSIIVFLSTLLTWYLVTGTSVQFKLHEMLQCTRNSIQTNRTRISISKQCENHCTYMDLLQWMWIQSSEFGEYEDRNHKFEEKRRNKMRAVDVWNSLVCYKCHCIFVAL